MYTAYSLFHDFASLNKAGMSCSEFTNTIRNRDPSYKSLANFLDKQKKEILGSKDTDVVPSCQR